MLYGLHNTRAYYKENREKIIQDENLRFKYRIRRKIMNLGRLTRKVVLNNVKMAQEEMKVLLSTQFGLLKNYYTKIN